MTYQSQKIITLFEFLNLLEDLSLNGESISRRKREWQLLIQNNKLTCPISGKKVAYCSYDHKVSQNTFHWNFYSRDGELFTIDHIIARSQGGESCNVENLQPMLHDYNMEKGKKTMDEFQKDLSKNQLTDYYDDILSLVAKGERSKFQIVVQDKKVVRPFNLISHHGYLEIGINVIKPRREFIQVNVTKYKPDKTSSNRCVYCGKIPDKDFLDMIFRNTYGISELY